LYGTALYTTALWVKAFGKRRKIDREGMDLTSPLEYDWFWNSPPRECTLKVLLERISHNLFMGPMLDLRGLGVEEQLDCTDYRTIGVALGEHNTVIR
jgi:hypothetical protein